MAAFSSRGWTDDSRIKPDLVAPGSWVLSGFSDLYQEPYDASPNPQNGFYQSSGWGFPLNDKLKYFGGTSMSAPLVAGGAAVVRDFYQKLHGHAASAALVKATLVNSAQDLLDEDNDGVNNNALAIPNRHEGWGRVDLAAATDGSRQFVDQATGLSTGATASYTYDVAAGTPLKVTLVWSDYPGNTAAAKDLVNNLDLEVSGPGGAFYRGNVFGGGWSIAGGLPNNTEQRRERLRADAGGRRLDRHGQGLQRASRAAAFCARRRRSARHASARHARPDRHASLERHGHVRRRLHHVRQRRLRLQPCLRRGIRRRS